MRIGRWEGVEAALGPGVMDRNKVWFGRKACFLVFMEISGKRFLFSKGMIPRGALSSKRLWVDSLL